MIPNASFPQLTLHLFNPFQQWLASSSSALDPAGLNLFQALAKQLSPADDTEVVVFEKSKYYYHAVGTPRAYTEEAFAKMLFIPYDNAIPTNARSFVRIVRAVVTSIAGDKNEVSYRTVRDSDDQLSATTETLAFDSLVIATGSTYTVPIKPDGQQVARSHTEEQTEGGARPDRGRTEDPDRRWRRRRLRSRWRHRVQVPSKASDDPGESRATCRGEQCARQVPELPQEHARPASRSRSFSASDSRSD
ncbi:hypothetical protein PINS_up021227 [Pythium insidiosum]|nr:hypothetical protein PINS_up021227 [Pythium insidiosum]